MNADLDDTHLCIKCSQTIIGLENYIQHRKQNCNRNTTTATVTTTNTKDSTSHTVTPSEHRNSDVTPPINYEPFNFNEPEQPTAASHGGKSSKNLGESYELPYELGADVFFSSLQLQSVQSSVAHHPVATHQSSGGKTGGPGQLQRQKSLQSDHSSHEVESWMATHHGDQHGSDNLLKAVNDMGEAKKSYEALFKPITYEHESPELSEEEEDDEADVDEIDDDDDEDYEPEAEGHATGGKWKLPLLRHSPPVVPATHTGGKWKPEHRPNLRVTHSQLSRLSPNWDDHMDDVDINDCQHPPSDHTKGKWIPGTKVQRLEYKEAVELAKHSTKQDYWCNICCRKLKSKAIYENHLKTSYPLKRYEPETQLEKAVIEEIPREDINKGFAVKTAKMHAVTTASTSAIGKKRKRRSTFLRCSLCKHVMSRHLIGKHLISHYHYRRMQLHPGLSLHMILDNIHSIVLQSPFQCRPCRFYANTEEAFLLHWSSASHLDASEGPGRFWCSYCRFECEDNNQMRRHLLSPEHKEVLLAINRSVPICISKRRTLSCLKCGSGFRYNFELRRHIRSHHPEMEYFGTASDIYQSKFKCLTCPEVLPSQIALQRHEKFKHSVSKYFCSICSLEFNSPCKARRHRKTLEHKQKASGIEKKNAKNMGEEKSTMDFEIRDIIEISKPKVSDSILATDSFITIYSDNMEYDVRCVSLHPAAELKWKDSVELKEWKTSNTCATENPITVIQDKIKIETNSDDEPCTSAEAIKREKLRKSLEIKKTNKCLNCQEIFQSRDQLIAHREKEHSLSVCMVCGEKFVNGQKLGQHLRKCKPKILGNRETSDSNAGTKGDVEMTSQEAKVTPEHGDVLRKCDLCEFVSPYESEIIFHNLYHTNVSMATQDQIKCPLCEKTFRKQSLRCHLRRHTNEKIFECTLCGLKYARKYNLKDHIDRVHGTVNKLEMGVVNQNIQKKDFQCDSCEKVFKSKRSLQDHCLTHHDSKPNHRFVCPRDSCDYRTHNKSLLKVHLASHSIESFKCPEKGCDSVGKSEFHLKRHKKIHLPDDEVRFYNCDQCKFRSKIKSHIKRHMRCHSGEKPYQCPYCDFRTNVLENLRKHVLKTDKHPGKSMYECKICEETAKDGQTDVKDVYKTNSFAEYQKHMGKSHDKFVKPDTIL